MKTAQRRVLVVVDVQQEYFDGALPIQYPPVSEALENIYTAISLAQSANIPVVLIQHQNVESAPVFAQDSEQQKLHPGLGNYGSLPTFVKNKASIFISGDFKQWVEHHGIDTVTLVGFMSNNCLLASASAAEAEKVEIEVLSNASGAISLSNEAGAVSARQLHETLMVLLHSNWAAVATVDSWAKAVRAQSKLPRSNLVSSCRARD